VITLTDTDLYLRGSETLLAYSDYLRLVGLPEGLLGGVDDAAFHALVARVDDRTVTAGLAFDHGDDCGIYNVSTLEHARRQGLGTAVTALLLHDALERGCHTASLQATSMAERLYAAIGFRDLGRILEFSPGAAAGDRETSVSVQ
jgi:ribosomal protein S18 acetylase RimI-like enzyme